MASKGIIRSIRISDQMLVLIEQQVGNNFTEKWENLVTRCVWELPEKERQLQQIQEQIEQERQRLRNLQKATSQLREIENDLATTSRYLKYVERRAKEVASAYDENQT